MDSRGYTPGIELRLFGTPAFKNVSPTGDIMVQLTGLLGVESGKVVSKQRLAEETGHTWAKGNTLHRRMNRLRGFGLPIENQSGGYLLQVAPTAVDVHVFRLLATQVQQHIRDRKADLANSALRSAMALAGRGQFLNGLGQGPVLSGWTDALAQRLKTLEFDSYRVALLLGQHEQVVDDLFIYWKECPEDRSAQLLALAMYRCGRIREIAEVVDHTRDVLQEILGITPTNLMRLVALIAAEDAKVLDPQFLP